MTGPSPEQAAGLDAARHLAAHGVPIFLAKPADTIPEGGHNGTGYWLPKRWQGSVPDPAALDDWAPRVAVCAVMGHVELPRRRDPGHAAPRVGRGGVRAPVRPPDWVGMQTRETGLEGTGAVDLRSLVKEALRMRPSRIIVDEVRAAECLDLCSC